MADALREVFVRFTAEADTKQLKEAHKGVEGLKHAAEAAAAVFAGSEIVHGIEEIAHRLEQVGELSEQTKLSTDLIQTLGYAYEQAGGSAEDMNNSLTLLQKSLGRTAEAKGPQVDALKELGVAMDPSKPRALADVLPQIFAGFEQVTDETKQAEIATSLFGRSGVRLLPLLRQGASGLDEVRASMAEFGGPVSEEAIFQAKEMGDAVKRMDHALFVFKANLASGVFPQVSRVVDGLGRGVTKIGEWTKGTTLAESATSALALTVGFKLFSALAPYLKTGLKFGAIYLAFDDLVAFLEGNESLIGDAIDAAFGPGSQATVRQFVDDSVADFQRFRGDVDAAFIAMGDSQADWLTRALAGMGLLTSSSIPTFVAIKEGWESILNDMGIAIDEFFLKWYKRWNGLAETLGLTGLLDIDTSKADQELAYLKQSQDTLQAKAYARSNPGAVLNEPTDVSEDRRAPGLFGGSAGGGLAEDRERLRASAARRANETALMGEGSGRRTASVADDATLRSASVAAPLFAPPVPVATIPSSSVVNNATSNTEVHVQVDAPVTFQGAPNVAETRAAVRAVERGARSAYRAAADALVPRAP